MAKFAKLTPKPHTRSRLVPLKDERIGESELTFLQLASANQNQARIVAAYDSPGLVVKVHADGQLAQDWKVADGGGSGKLTILAGDGKPALAIDKNGDVIQLNADETTSVDFIADGATKYVTVKKAVQNYELGTLTVPGNSGVNITGSGTKFAEFFDRDTLGRGDFIELLAADLVDANNAGKFEIKTITNDTTLELVTGPTGAAEETPVKFKIAGSFYKNNDPIDPSIHEFDHFAFTANNDPPDFNSEKELLALVTRTGESIAIIDLRQYSLARLRNVPAQAATRLQPAPAAQGPVQLEAELGQFNVALAEVAGPTLMAVYSNESNKALRIKASTNGGNSWIAKANIPSGNNPIRPDIIKLFDEKILVCYHGGTNPDRGVHVVKSTDIFGDAWAAGTLVVNESDLTANESINTQSLFLDERGQIYLFYMVKKDDDSAATWRVKRSVDGSATWQTAVDIATVGASRTQDRGGCVQTNSGDLYFIFSRTANDSTVWLNIYKSETQGLSWTNQAILLSIGNPGGGVGAYISKPVHIPSTNETYIFYSADIGAEAQCVAYLKLDNLETGSFLVFSRNELLYIPNDNEDLFTLRHSAAIQMTNKDIALLMNGAMIQIGQTKVIFRKIFPFLMG